MTTIPAAVTQAELTACLDLTHVYCCNPDLALCGEDVSDTPEVDEDGQLCVVCADLEEQPCICPPAPESS